MEAIDVTIGPNNSTNRSTAVETPSKKKRFGGLKAIRGKKLVIAVIALILIILAGFFYYKYSEARKEVNRLSNPQEAAKSEAIRLRDEVGQFYQVPDEIPTVATVVDASKLKSQAFFANAENGDRVLMFTQAKKAILYRPSIKKIIEVAPINLGNNQSSQSTQTQDQSTQVESSNTQR